MRIYHVYVSVVCACLLFVWPNVLFGQSAKGKGNVIVREISLEASSILPVSINISDTIVKDVLNNAVLYCYPDDYESFWYKIVVKAECEVTFEIFPENSDNTYNYFLYKNTGDLSVMDIETKNIYPIRANLFKDKMEKSGTGLSRSVQINYNDTSSMARARQFYHTAYHGGVPVKPGDILMLNVYHIKGTDCGQTFVLKTEKTTQKFRSLYKTCYKRQVETVKTDNTLNLKPQPVPAPVTAKKPEAQQAANATYTVWDSLKHTVIEAEINWTKRRKNIYAIEKGSGEIVLEKNTSYSVTFSAVGFKNKSVSFSTKDSLRSFSHYIFLTPVKEGENFSMDKIYFFPNTYAMRPGAGAELDKLLKYLLSNPGVKVEIQGFTNGNNRIKASADDMGEGSFTGSSKKLSQLRAETIKKYLTDKGVGADRLIANGYGGSQMIYQKPKNQEEANKNIRVGVLILSQKEVAFTSNTTSR